MEGHMVAFVKLYGPYAGKSDEGEWVLINDFSLEVTKEAEVHRLYGERKVPCLLYYTQRSVVKDAKSKQRWRIVGRPCAQFKVPKAHMIFTTDIAFSRDGNAVVSVFGGMFNPH